MSGPHQIAVLSAISICSANPNHTAQLGIPGGRTQSMRIAPMNTTPAGTMSGPQMERHQAQ